MDTISGHSGCVIIVRVLFRLSHHPALKLISLIADADLINVHENTFARGHGLLLFG
jgi:hypothetical protein